MKRRMRTHTTTGTNTGITSTMSTKDTSTDTTSTKNTKKGTTIIITTTTTKAEKWRNMALAPSYIAAASPST